MGGRGAERSEAQSWLAMVRVVWVRARAGRPGIMRGGARGERGVRREMKEWLKSTARCFLEDRSAREGLAEKKYAMRGLRVKRTRTRRSPSEGWPVSFATLSLWTSMSHFLVYKLKSFCYLRLNALPPLYDTFFLSHAFSSLLCPCPHPRNAMTPNSPL